MFISYIFPGLLFFSFFSCSDKVKENEQKVIKQAVDIKYEVFAAGLQVPWSIVFTSASRVLINERPGRLRIIENDNLQPNPLHTFNDVSSSSEEGLMGLALDPNYNSNKILYLSYAYKKDNSLFVKVVRFKDNGNNLSDETIILDGLPAERYHAGCRLRFGPDGKLYITTGDAGERKYAQDLTKTHGKILRINGDGSVPTDNPFPGSPVWSYGHRNPQGIDWYPGTSILWETEHGPSGFDGPGGGDEVNVIEKGKNYGWPVVSHENSKEGMESPLLVFTPAEAPASGVFIKSDKIPEYKNNFFFGCLRGEGIIRVVVDENDRTKVKSYEKFATDFGRIRDVAEGPDGYIYFSTSNRDGRGKVREGDDKIFRITPK
ncbi:MAG TPA: PQQ-dependent sugar dehydrogenase [Ignavibacteria bacterium]|jgi:glucose/arabinose dehydrogenase